MFYTHRPGRFPWSRLYAVESSRSVAYDTAQLNGGRAGVRLLLPDLKDFPCSESDLYGLIKLIARKEERVTGEDSIF